MKKLAEDRTGIHPIFRNEGRMKDSLSETETTCKSGVGERRWLKPVMILCIMALSVFSRLPFHGPLMDYGEGFIDSETGLPYLLDMDGYYHVRMTNDIALYGHPGETVKEGEPWDSLSYAPSGRTASDYKPLMASISIAVNHLISLFVPMSLEQTDYWLNTFLSALVIVPVFLIVFEMCGLTGAVVASVLASLNYMYLCYTMPGYYDTDGVTLWVSCFFFYFGLKLFKGWEEKNKKSLIIGGIGFALSFTALFYSWYEYYVFPVLFAGVLVLFTLLTWRKKKGGRLYSLIPLLTASGIIAVILITGKGLISRIGLLLDKVFLGTESSSVFQNVYLSIKELQKPALWTSQISGLFQLDVFSQSNFCIINAIGGILPFLFAVAMFLILLLRMIKKGVRFDYLFLLVWFLVTFLLSFTGNRFTMLFAIPAGILAGNLAENLAGKVSGLLEQRSGAKRKLCRVILPAVLLAALLLPTLYSVYSMYGMYRADADSFDPEEVWDYRSLEESLSGIRENTPKNTVLVSWWDLGYFMEEKAEREALFDGGTQYDQRSFFVARAFATEDEELSANIFSMLSGSGDEGCDLMFSTFGETEDTLLFMNELLSGSKSTAMEKLLKKDISEDRAKELAELLFPEDTALTECIITPDLPLYAKWFPLFGRTATEQDENPMEFVVEMQDMPVELSESGKTVVDSENGYDVILEKGEDEWYAWTSSGEEASEEQPPYIDRLIFVDPHGNREYVQNHDLSGEELSWTAIVTDDGQETTLSLVSSSLADSILGRLFYLGGEGLTRYKAEPEFSNDTLVYRVMKVKEAY